MKPDDIARRVRDSSLGKSAGQAHAAADQVYQSLTRPDRPQGRSRSTLVPPPVKSVAVEEGLPVLQPEKPGAPEFIQTLAQLAPDLGIVVAYGHILKAELLAVPPLGFINVHASLLPALRGAAPIQHALLQGLTETGITIMKLEQALDAGPVLLQVATPIAADETAAEEAPPDEGPPDEGPPDEGPPDEEPPDEESPDRVSPGEDDTAFGEIDPPNWRQLELHCPKRDGSWAEVSILFPLTWLSEQGARVGGSIPISVPECGIDGDGKILARRLGFIYPLAP